MMDRWGLVLVLVLFVLFLGDLCDLRGVWGIVFCFYFFLFFFLGRKKGKGGGGGTDGGGMEVDVVDGGCGKVCGLAGIMF